MNFFQTDFGLNFKIASQKFIKFWPSKNCFILFRNVSDWGQVKDQRKADDVI